MALPLLGLGSMLANIGRVGRAGVGAYRTMQGIRAARAAEGIPMGYQRVLGTTGTGLGSGTSGTGLQGLMARGAKKYPGASGSLEAGTGVLLGGEGVGDIMEGYQEGDIGQLAMGLGSLALGTPLASRGLRLAGSSRKLPQGAREAMRTTGKEFSARIPRGTTAVGLGGIGTGLVLGDETPATQGEPQVISQNPVDIVIKAIEYDKANPKEAKEKLGFDVSSPEYKKLAQEQLTKAYQEAEKMDMKPKQTIDEISQVFMFDPKSMGGAKVTNQATMPNDQSGGSMSESEINAVAQKQLEEAEKGKAIKNKIDKSLGTSKEAEEFNRFYKQITDLTGGNDQTNNLLLFKLATGLMKGKTSQSGVRGFIDVLGQAGSETTDTAMALFAKEADRRKDLAVSYLKAKEKNKSFGAIEKDRKTVVVRDPNLPFGARSVEVATNKETGLDMMIVPAADGVGTQAVPMQYTEYTPVKVSEARLDKRRKQLNSIEQGYELTQAIANLPTGTLGTKGATKLAVENVLGTFGDIGEMLGLGNLGTAESPIDATILNEYIGGKKIDRGGNEVAPTEAERKEVAKLQEAYRNEIKSITADIKPGQTELDNITKARLIEVRMKYILANALKDEDRLTRADIEDAAESTQVLKFFSSDKAIRSSYKNLAENLEKQFDRVAKDYIEAGGSEKYLNNFRSMPKIANILAAQQNELYKKNIQQNQINVLGTIE